MSLPTLEWTITDEQLLGQIDPDWAGMSNDPSGLLAVNFLAHIARHITDNSAHFEVNSSAFDATDGTVVLGLKSAVGQRLSGINIILGCSTANVAGMGGLTLAGGTVDLGLSPHNNSVSSQCKNIIWMAMTIGMTNPGTPGGLALNPNDWSDLDWADNAVIPYSGSNPRFSGFAMITGNLGLTSSDAMGIRIIESPEAIFFFARSTATATCFLGGCGAIVIPQDTTYAEAPGTGGWNDSSGGGANGENNRVFGITGNPVQWNGPGSQVTSDFWSRTPSNNSTVLTSAGNNSPIHSAFSIFDPLAQSNELKKAVRLSSYHVARQYGGDLTTPSGTRVHLDIALKVGENPNYFLGKIRQIRAGQDGISGTILKDGAGAVKSITWSISSNSAGDVIAFDNE